MVTKNPDTALLTGNEAIARGAIEAGIGVVTGYPGTPASEIVETLAREPGLHAEWSTNETVAFEVAAAASMAGVRSLCAMKHLGVNWIADPLTVVAYTGVEGGLVIVTADDPAQFSSQNATDTRYFAMLSKVPCLEPADGQEARDLLVEAFKISEELKLPVLFRVTPRICHSTFDVRPGPIQPVARQGRFVKDAKRYVMIASNSSARHPLLNQKLAMASKLFDKSGFNKVEGGGTAGIIASGVSYLYVREALDMLKRDAAPERRRNVAVTTGMSASVCGGLRENVKVLKLATTVPLPEGLVKNFLEGLENVLVVEELEPIVENAVKAIAHDSASPVRIFGKNILPRAGELDVDIVGSALGKFLGVDAKRQTHGSEFVERARKMISKRIPSLCPGCPHRATYHSIKKVMAGRGIVTGDRGCYNQGAHPPLSAIDTCICMGASIPMASGFFHSGIEEPVVAVIGDGTFFHAGLPGLINAVHNNSPIVTVIMDNEWTSMTGHQPNPGTGINALGKETRKVSIEELVKACGVRHIWTVDAYDLKEVERAVGRALEAKAPAVVISRRPCVVQYYRHMREIGVRPKKMKVLPEKCAQDCGQKCMRELGCPAFGLDGNGKARIDSHCNGCGVCAQVCPKDAITVR